MIRHALQSGVPVLWVPNDLLDRKPLQLAKHSYAQLIETNFDRVSCGIGERLYLKGQAPQARDVFAANAALWPTFQFRGLDVWAHNDPQQDLIPLRYLNATLQWARLCRTMGRDDLALPAYQRAGVLYPDLPEVQQGIAASTAALARLQPTAVPVGRQ